MVSDGRLPCCRNVRIVSRYFATRLAVLQWTPFAGHDRASLQESYCFARDGRPSLDTIVRPYRSRIALLEIGTLWLDTSRAPLQRATGLIRRLVRFAERIFHSKMQFGVEVSVLACASKKKKSIFATSSAFKYR